MYDINSNQSPNETTAVKSEEGRVRGELNTILTSNPSMDVMLTKLIKVLRCPQSHQRQLQIARLLKTNPNLMAAFVKQREAKRLAEQQK